MSFYGGFQVGAFQTDFQTSTVVTDIGPSVISFLPASSRNQVNEGSDYYLSIAYYDVFGNSITPVAASWKIYDDTNKVILQPWTAYTPTGPIDTIHIASTYDALGNPLNLVETRQVTFLITSSGGNQRYDYGTYYVIGLDDVP